MKTKQNDPRHESNSRELSIRKSYDDFNVLEPDPDNDFQFLGDEDDEFSDYTLMNLDQDQDPYL